MGDDSHSSSDLQLRWPSIRSCSVAVVALATAAAFANVSRSQPDVLTDTSLTRVIIVSGVIPWALQVLAVVGLVKSSRRGLHRKDLSLKFATMTVTLIGVSWWLGILPRHYGQTPMEAVTQTVQQEFAGESLPFVVISRICGPLIAIGRLHGLYVLAGTDYFHSLTSICLLTGYLTFTARVCQVGAPGPTTARDVVRLTLMIFVVFIPSLIRFGIDLLQTAS